MIHDAEVPVTCDNERCLAEISVEPPYRYMTYSGGGGHYDTSDSTIEELLVSEDWIVKDGKHYCCIACVEEDLFVRYVETKE